MRPVHQSDAGNLNPIFGSRLTSTGARFLGLRSFTSDLCLSGLSSRYLRQARSISTPFPCFDLASFFVFMEVLFCLGFVLKFPIKNLPRGEVKVNFICLTFFI